QLETDLACRGIVAFRAALVADLLQAARRDSEAEQAVLVSFQRRRQRAALEFLLGQRVIGREDAVAQGDIQAGRRLPRPRYAHQDQLGLAVVARARAVVVL